MQDSLSERAAEMERELKAKLLELAEQQRLNRRPPVRRVREKDITAAIAQLRQLLDSDVGLAAKRIIRRTAAKTMGREAVHRQPNDRLGGGSRRSVESIPQSLKEVSRGDR